MSSAGTKAQSVLPASQNQFRQGSRTTQKLGKLFLPEASSRLRPAPAPTAQLPPQLGYLETRECGTSNLEQPIALGESKI